MSDRLKLGPVGALALLCVATLTTLTGFAIAPALPEIAARSGMQTNASWLITLPALGVVLFAPLAADLTGRAGARRSLQVGLILYGFLGMVGAFLHQMDGLMLDRFLLGGAAALVLTSSTTLITRIFSGEMRLRMFIRQGMAIGLGSILILAIGGYIATIGWRLPYSLYLISWIFLILVTLSVPDPGKPRPLSEPVPDSSSFQRITDICFAGCASQVLFFTGIIALPKFLVSQNLSAADCGYYLAFMAVIAVLVAGVTPRILALTGERHTILLAFAAYCVAHIIFSTASALPVLIIAGMLMGIGFGLTMPLTVTTVLARSAPAQRGRFLTALTVAVFLGQFLSSFLDRFSPSLRDTFHLASLFAVVAFAAFWGLSSWVAASEPKKL